MTQEQLRQIEGEARAERDFICARYDSYAFSPELYRVVKKLETDAAWAAHERAMRKQAWNSGTK
jgi:hypothetical protein